MLDPLEPEVVGRTVGRSDDRVNGICEASNQLPPGVRFGPGSVADGMGDDAQPARPAATTRVRTTATAVPLDSGRGVRGGIGIVHHRTTIPAAAHTQIPREPRKTVAERSINHRQTHCKLRFGPVRARPELAIVPYITPTEVGAIPPARWVRAAEAARFELAMGFKTQTRLAGGRHRPD